MLQGGDGGTVAVVMPQSGHGQHPGGTPDPHEVSFSSHRFPPQPAVEFDVSWVLDDIPERDGIQDHHCTSHFHS